MAPLPPLRDGGCALPICPFGRACLPLISDAPDCKCSPGRLRFWVVWASRPGAAAPISIHAPRVGRDRGFTLPAESVKISIHAPRVGRDVYVNYTKTIGKISIHAPRVGRDHRAATSAFCGGIISIHAPRVGRDPAHRERLCRQDQISIHAPRVGRDAGTSTRC